MTSSFIVINVSIWATEDMFFLAFAMLFTRFPIAIRSKIVNKTIFMIVFLLDWFLGGSASIMVPTVAVAVAFSRLLDLRDNVVI